MLLHNFAGRPSVAHLAAAHGFYMSFPPAVTTKPERNKLLKSLPLERLCLETDSPALARDTNVSRYKIQKTEDKFYIEIEVR